MRYELRHPWSITRAITAAVIILMLLFVASVKATNDNLPPGNDGENCHGANMETCRPDPQPSHGADCDPHGNNPDGNDDHCTEVTPDVTFAPTEEPTSTPMFTSTPTVEPTVMPTSTPTESPSESPSITAAPSEPTSTLTPTSKPRPTQPNTAASQDEPEPPSPGVALFISLATLLYAAWFFLTPSARRR